MKYIIEGLDRVGKNLLIDGILDKLGYHQVIHYSKPKILSYHSHDIYSSVETMKLNALRAYQQASFRTMFQLLNSPYLKLILNRGHLGEAVYAERYRGYDGDYVFDMEEQFHVEDMNDVRLILLTENLTMSQHFQDDGLSLGKETDRADEQELFINAFQRSRIKNKREICVTDTGTGKFRPAGDILIEALQ